MDAVENIEYEVLRLFFRAQNSENLTITAVESLLEDSRLRPQSKIDSKGISDCVVSTPRTNDM